jgi:hypothetical protein
MSSAGAATSHGNVDRLARALTVDLPTLMAGVEAQRSR